MIHIIHLFTPMPPYDSYPLMTDPSLTLQTMGPMVAVIMLIAVYGFGVPIPGIGQEGGLASGMIEGSVLIMFQAILACVLAYVTARHRGLSKKSRVGWSIAGSLGGFGVALAIIAIYPRCFREACTCCKKPRRVELLECEHCGSEWELPARDGIEVLENPSETENLVLQ